MHDDDRLDPILVERFRALDEVLPPDTWPGDATHRTSRGRWWPVLAAAAAVALIVGVAVALSGADEGAIVGAPVTSPPTVPTTSSTTAELPVDAVADALALAEPSVVRPGGRVTITPARVVEQYCNKVNVFGPVTGTVMGGVWTTSDGVAATYSCDGPVTDEAVELTVPDLPDGEYRFCVAELDIPEGCARVSIDSVAVRAPGALAVAEPSIVLPGQQVAITPAGPVERICTDIVDVLGRDDDGLIGQITGGRSWTPVTVDGPPATVPACQGEVTAESLVVTVPPVDEGTYRFCVASGAQPEACAEVEVLASMLLADVSSREVAVGDVVTITPANSIARLCTGGVRVADPARAVAVLEVIDLATGSTEEQPFGGWEAPDCEPEPSGAAVTLVVPDVAVGAYAFCLAADLASESCALVYVVAQRTVEPPEAPGSTVPPIGRSFSIEMGAHCGFSHLSQQIDGRSWVTDEAPDVFEWTPDEWADAIDPSRPEQLVLTIVLSEDGSELTATANGRTVRYRPVAPTDSEFFCA